MANKVFTLSFILWIVASGCSDTFEIPDSSTSVNAIKFKGSEQIQTFVTRDCDFVLSSSYKDGVGFFVYDSVGIKKQESYLPDEFSTIPDEFSNISVLNDCENGDLLIGAHTYDNELGKFIDCILRVSLSGEVLDTFNLAESISFLFDFVEYDRNTYYGLLGVGQENTISSYIVKRFSKTKTKKIYKLQAKERPTAFVSGDGITLNKNGNILVFGHYERYVDMKFEYSMVMISLNDNLEENFNTSNKYNLASYYNDVGIEEKGEMYILKGQTFNNFVMKRMEFSFTGELLYEAYYNENVSGTFHGDNGVEMAYGNNFSDAGSQQSNNVFVAPVDSLGQFSSKESIGSVNRKYNIVDGGYSENRFRFLLRSKSTTDSKNEYFFIKTNKFGKVVTE